MSHGPLQSTGDSAAQPLEFLDRYPWLPVLLLVLLPFLFHLPFWLFGLSTDPLYFSSGVTHSTHLLPKIPYLDENAGFTTEALGHLAAWDWVHGIVPWWNSYTGVGMPLAGELQPAAFFLPFNLLLLLPEGPLWQRIAMQIIAGLTTFALLRELGLSRLASLMGGTLYAFNGTIAWTPGPSAVYCSLPFLPLLLWGIERARKPSQGALSTLAVGAAIAWSILAGFPEPAYIGGLMALAWGLYRLFAGKRDWLMARRAIIGWVLGVMVAAPLLIAFVDFLKQSDSFTVHKTGQASLSWPAFSATVMPYVYGPLTMNFNSKILGRMWGDIGGYTGPLILMMAIVGLSARSAHRGLKILLSAWVLLAWARTFGVQPVMAIVNHLPLLDHAAFHRYSPPSWTLALIILAAFGLDDLRENRPHRRRSFAIVLTLLAICVTLAWPQRSLWAWPHTQVLLMFGLLAVSLIWALAGLGTAWIAWNIKSPEPRRIALASLLVIDAVAMFTLAQSSAMRNNTIDTPAIRFLQDHQGLSRTYSMGPLLPNYGAFFQIASIDHNVLPVPKLWADHVDQHLLPGLLKGTDGVVFWPNADGFAAGEGEQMFSQNLTQYLDLGVRFVITAPGHSPLATIAINPEDVTAQSPQGSFTMSSKGTAFRILSKAHAVADSPSSPAPARFVARSVIRALDRPRVPSVDPVEASKDIALRDGEHAEVTVTAPIAPTGSSPISSVGVMLQTQVDAVRGKLNVTICAGTSCQTGQRLLAESAEDTIFQVPLDQPLAASAGTPLHITFSQSGGQEPVLLATSEHGEAQQLKGPTGFRPGRALKLAFQYPVPAPGFHKVYADTVMDIWEIPDTTPYFEVVQGGPCMLSEPGRESVTSDCSTPATLLRRELFMPGWSVTHSGTQAQDVQQGGIFQTTIVPAGRSHAQYHFLPPHAEAGWFVCALGVLGLLWQVFGISRDRRRVAKPA